LAVRIYSLAKELKLDSKELVDLCTQIGITASVAAKLSATPGVVDHGLFGPELVSDVLIAHGSEIEHRTIE